MEVLQERKDLKRPYKIGLIGCAGLGKSTFATEISKKLCIPFLNSKGITRPVLKRQGWDSATGTYVEKILARKEIEFEIVSRRLEEESFLQGGFVTDRTTLECFCYSFLSLFTYTKEDLQLLEKTCKGNMKNYTHLFFVPLKEAWYEENGIRTTDLNFQRMVDLIIRGVISDWGISVVEIPEKEIIQGKVSEFIISEIEKGEKDEQE